MVPDDGFRDREPPDAGTPEPHASSPEELLDAVLGDFLTAEAEGRGPNRKLLLARHPELASKLLRFFADEDLVEGLVREMEAIPPYGLPPGERSFGDYEVLEEIARGGMGVVYRARQVSQNRTVALKVMLSGPLASDNEVDRFRLEAEAAASLDDHPGIVPIYEVGEKRGLHYFTMKLIEGESLAQRIERSSLEPREAAELVERVARAVHHAHGQGVLHLDLKPANILLDASGEPYLTDFGLARRFRGQRPLTLAGSRVGTLNYLSPEQAAGRRGAATVSSDVYSLGVILYECLVGRPPFLSGCDLETLEKIASECPTRPSHHGRNVPRELETICLKCLEKDPRLRYGSAEELAEDLRRFLEGLPAVCARPPSPGGQL
jgi:serine/threonine-protein kinase